MQRIALTWGITLLRFHGNRKLSFKLYEERKLAAEKIIKESNQLEEMFNKFMVSKQVGVYRPTISPDKS